MSRRTSSPIRSVAVLAAATLAGTALAVPLAAAPAAQAAAAPALGTVDTYTGLKFTVPAGTNDLGQPQTCTIDADLYKPHSASPSARVPAILTTNGFGGSKADQAGLGEAFAKRGYAVLSYTGLGFPNSGCKISLDDPAVDGVAASSLVTFLGGGGSAAYTSSQVGGTTGGPGTLGVDFTVLDNPATHDPRLGMIGGSYGGQIQFATAAVDSRVDTLVPLITWNDLRYSLAPNNTSFTSGVTYAGSVPGTEKLGWTDLFFGVGIADGLQGAAIDPTRNVGCPNFVLEACGAKATLDTLGYPTPTTYQLTDRVSVGHYIDKVRIPTFLIQGENDTLFNLQEAAATYRSLKARGVPVTMAWQSWGHSGGTGSNSGAAPGELDLSGQHIEDTYLGLRIKNWFDHYLKRAAVSTGPTFAYFRDWVGYTGSAAPAYASSSTYPVGTRKALYLSSANELVSSKSAILPGSTSWSNPGGGAAASYTEISGLEGRVPLPSGLTTPFDTPGTFGAWSTPAQSTPLTIVGAPTLDVRFDSPAVALTQSAGPSGQLQVFAKLYDVAPDGTKTLVHKLISPVRVADVTQPVHIELPAIVHRVAAGHRIELVLASTDAAYKNAYAVQPVTVHASPLTPATLSLPVTP
ncbi:ABC-2 type transport system ATP-binding protein [Phycicoccus badiiscoriae]|uniref:ABC-2 type transport system ATP-binding protein n=1 Tax=Pedococcus badiiscoriae TaxID=642776 RepID=A0A852WFG5_9MICO|nr:CocE/NonD family hydrolase [Pedococcus badiiscoriae]NYG07510.1 ABC-2 type transport system ATP-binding protein [Pedococcus badiiscoriae]